MIRPWLTLVLGMGLGACAVIPPILDKPSVQIEDLSLEHFDPQAIDFTLHLKVKNPNRVSITLQSAVADLMVENQAIAQGHSSTPVVLPAHGETTVNVSVRADVAKTRRLLAEMMLDPSRKRPYRLKGEATFTDLHLSQEFDRQGEESLLTWFRHK